MGGSCRLSWVVCGLCWIVLVEGLGEAMGGVVPAVYVFGDSLVDVGNNDYIVLSLLKANFPHNGVDYPGRKATGRFSNGKNAADFIAEKVGLPTSPPYLSLKFKSSKADAFLQGVNFASGGAGILNTTNKDHCLSLDKQIEYYTTVHASLVQQLGSDAAQTHLSKSLFAIVIGSNDMFGYIRNNDQNKPSPQQFIDSLISNLNEKLRILYGLGARKVAFVGTGPIGCCPSQRSHNKSGECLAEANYLSSKYNEGASALLKVLTSEFSDMTYIFFDTRLALLEYINNPTKYGFVEVEAACCGLGDLRAKVACLPIATYCSNREHHIFWDFYHPTEAVARMLIDVGFEGSQPYVFPNNMKQLVAL